MKIIPVHQLSIDPSLEKGIRFHFTTDPPAEQVASFELLRVAGCGLRVPRCGLRVTDSVLVSWRAWEHKDHREIQKLNLSANLCGGLRRLTQIRVNKIEPLTNRLFN